VDGSRQVSLEQLIDLSVGPALFRADLRRGKPVEAQRDPVVHRHVPFERAREARPEMRAVQRVDHGADLAMKGEIPPFELHACLR
jgi:hypothetical protein